jgi:glutathione synthase/RimK-type ligase-like ATP-grasp enzyme
MSYQHEIDKIYDLRVILVGDKIFPTAIHSQDQQETAVDWRVADLKELQLRHEKIFLPKQLKQKCRELVRFFSLRYSSMDFVLGKDGKYYFLELNPNGQWAWIEQLVGYPIRDAIINTLTHDWE